MLCAKLLKWVIYMKLLTQVVCVRLNLLIYSFNQLSGAHAFITTAHAQLIHYISVFKIIKKNMNRPRGIFGTGPV